MYTCQLEMYNSNCRKCPLKHFTLFESIRFNTLVKQNMANTQRYMEFSRSNKNQSSHLIKRTREKMVKKQT